MYAVLPCPRHQMCRTSRITRITILWRAIQDRMLPSHSTLYRLLLCYSCSLNYVMWPATFSVILSFSLPENNAWGLTGWERRNLDFWLYSACSLCLLVQVFREKMHWKLVWRRLKPRKWLGEQTILCLDSANDSTQWSYWCVKKERSTDYKINIEVSMNWKLIGKKSFE